MRYAIGVDIGGTNLVVGSVSLDGAVLRGLLSEPTMAEAGSADVIDRLEGIVRRTMDATRREDPQAEFIGIGVGALGGGVRRIGVLDRVADLRLDVRHRGRVVADDLRTSAA